MSVLAAAAAALAVLAACEPPPGPPEAAGTPAVPATPSPTAPDTITGGTLRFAISEAATAPSDAVEPDSLIVVDALFDGLTAWDASLIAVPAAATSWETDDGRTWRFQLRDGATFHDGRPVTAEDFKFAWEVAARDGVAGFHLRLVEGYAEVAAGEADQLSGVEAEDHSTLVVRLREPYGQFPTVVAHPALGPLPRAAWLEDPAAFRRQPVGNGPFMAAEAVVPGGFLRLQRFDAWVNGPAPAQLDELLFQFMDAETAFVAFQQGRLQVSPLPEGAVAVARERYGRARDGYRGTGVVDGVTPTVYFLGFDVTAPPFDDPQVRRAVSLAIDRERITQAILGGNVTPADALVAPALSGRAGACEACVHDPAEAEAILAEHAIDSVTLWFNRDGGHRTIAQQVRADLVAAGVGRVTFRAPPFEEFVEKVAGGEAGMFRFGWQPEYPLADDVLYPLLHSGNVPPAAAPTEPPAGATEPPAEATEPPAEGEATEPAQQTDPPAQPTEPPAQPTEPPAEPAEAEPPWPGEGHNYMRYADPEVDALLAQARATTSSMRRMYLHRQVEEIALNRDQVVVPLFFYRHQRVVDERVVGFAVNPMGLVDLHRVLLRPDTRDPGPIGSVPTLPPRPE